MSRNMGFDMKIELCTISQVDSDLHRDVEWQTDQIWDSLEFSLRLNSSLQIIGKIVPHLTINI